MSNAPKFVTKLFLLIIVTLALAISGYQLFYSSRKDSKPFEVPYPEPYTEVIVPIDITAETPMPSDKATVAQVITRETDAFEIKFTDYNEPQSRFEIGYMTFHTFEIRKKPDGA